MGRAMAIIEREMRRFRRSPMLIVMSMIMPIAQLVILGYAFGGNVKHLKLAIVDQDHGVPAVRIRELAYAAASGARTLDLVEYADPGVALNDLRNGRVNGVMTIPPDFSRRALSHNEPRVALISDNTDTVVAASMAGTLGGLLGVFNAPRMPPRAGRRTARGGRGLSARAVSTCCLPDRHVDLHDGDDRRRHYLYRRQNRGLHARPGDADHRSADRRVQYLARSWSWPAW
jgi:hypothetical protein